MSMGEDRPNMDICEVIVKTLEGTVDEESFHQLESMLAEDKSLQRYYAAFVKMWVQLDSLVQMDSSDTAVSEAIAEDDRILQSVIEHDLEAMEQRPAMSTADIEEIRRITEEQLQKYLEEHRYPPVVRHSQNAGRTYVREYLAYQAQRLARPMKALAACLIIVLAAVFAYNQLAKGPRLKHATNAWVYREDNKLTATKAERLRDGDVIVTGDGGDAFIRYRGEDTTVHLDENTRFVIETHEGGKQYTLEQGTMDADVAPQPIDRPMIIRSEQGECRVLGTDFQVSSNPLGSWLAVRNGRVQLTRKWDKKAIEVDGGQYTIAAPGMELTTRPFNDSMDLSKDFWLVWPHPLGSRSIAMRAMGDLQNADIEYYFECVSGGGRDSGWQASPSFMAENLQPNSEYAYRLKVRHANQNDTCSSWSLAAVTRTTEAVTMEAESGELSGIFAVGEDATASGGRNIYMTRKFLSYEFNSSVEKNRASYSFTIMKPGLYRIRAWSKAPTTSRNSFFIRIDGDSDTLWNWNVETSTDYVENYVNNVLREKVDNGDEGFFYTYSVKSADIWLDAGEHTIDFYVRESGVFLDRFELERIPNT